MLCITRFYGNSTYQFWANDPKWPKIEFFHDFLKDCGIDFFLEWLEWNFYVLPLSCANFMTGKSIKLQLKMLSAIQTGGYFWLPISAIWTMQYTTYWQQELGDFWDVDRHSCREGAGTFWICWIRNALT